MIDISIKTNLDKIINTIDNRAKLIAVTKYVEADKLNSLIEYGIKDIAENKVQNLIDRRETFGDSFNYHMIGRLQTNKVKYLVGWVEMIHSLDRLSLLKELDKRGRQNDFIFNCLIQLNISREESKTGIYLEDLDKFIQEALKCDFVNIRGFMTMAPFTDSQEIVEEVFTEAEKIFEFYKNIRYNNFNIEFLSMGMSGDYIVALDKGSNMVRIGSKIFE